MPNKKSAKIEKAKAKDREKKRDDALGLERFNLAMRAIKVKQQ